MYKDFREMSVWKDAMKVAEVVFTVTNNLPRKEDYGFTSQIRRSALSVSANIAEAFGREHVNDKINFYYYSRGSLLETKSHLIYGKRVGYISPESFVGLEEIIDRIYLEINKIIKSIKSRK
jgi:four helix bundle protein